MKRWLYLFISLGIIFSLCSCSNLSENTLAENTVNTSWEGLKNVRSSSDVLEYTETVNSRSNELATQALQYSIEDLSDVCGYEHFEKAKSYKIIICSKMNLNCSGYTDDENKLIYIEECPLDLIDESTALVYYIATITHELLHVCSYTSPEKSGFTRYTYYEGQETYDVANVAINEAFTQLFTIEMLKLTYNVDLTGSELDTYTDFRPLVNALVERDGIEKWRNMYLTSDISKLEEIKDFSNISQALDTKLASENQSAYNWAVQQLEAQNLWKK